MAEDIPDARFRLAHTFVVQPEIVVDDGPARGLLIGRNSDRGSFDAIYLGKHAETPHRNVWMDVRGAHVLYVMGKRRSGKSYTLGALAEGLVSNSWVRQGDSGQGAIVLDTMNVFLTMPFAVSDTEPETSAASQELAKWRIPSLPIPLTVFAPGGTLVPDGVQSQPIHLRASDLGVEEWCGLFELDPFVDPQGHLITTLVSKMRETGIADRAGTRRFPPRNEYAISDLIGALEMDPEFDNFTRDTRQALRRRFDALAKTQLFATNGLDVRALVRPSHISVLLLRDLDPEMRAVLVSLIVKKIMELRAVSEQQERLVSIHLSKAEKFAGSEPEKAERERQSAAACTERAARGIPRTWLIIDEAHNYIPARTNPPSKRPIKKYVDEGRNLGLSIVVATQQPSGLDPSIQRNADMLLVHSLSHQDDIAAAQGMLNTSIPEEVVVDGKHRVGGSRTFEALVRNLPLGYAIAVSDRANRLFPICVRPRSTVHGGGDY